VAAVGAAQQELYFVDAHSQVDQTVDLNRVIGLMDQAGTRYTIPSAVGGRTSEEIVAFSRQHPDRIIPAVRMKRRAYDENDVRYYEGLRRKVESDNFKAMSEVMMYHAQRVIDIPK
jgi:hypothetical protein